MCYRGTLWLLILSLGVSACGTGLVVVSYQQLVVEAMQAGLPDTLATQGIVAGLNSFFFSVG